MNLGVAFGLANLSADRGSHCARSSSLKSSQPLCGNKASMSEEASLLLYEPLLLVVVEEYCDDVMAR